MSNCKARKYLFPPLRYLCALQRLINGRCFLVNAERLPSLIGSSHRRKNNINTTTMSEENINESVKGTDEEKEQQEETISKAEHDRIMAMKDKALNDLRAKQESQEEEDDTDISDEDAIVAKAKEAVIREIREADISRYKETSVSEMYKTEWGSEYSPENDVDGSKMARLNDALAKVNELHPPSNSDDLTLNLRRADQLVKGIVDNSFEKVEKAQQGAIQAKMAVGGGGSNVRRQTAAPVKLTELERKTLKAAGITPEEYQKSLG